MKKILSFFLLIYVLSFLYSQTEQKFSTIQTETNNFTSININDKFFKFNTILEIFPKQEINLWNFSFTKNPLHVTLGDFTISGPFQKLKDPSWSKYNCLQNFSLPKLTNKFSSSQTPITTRSQKIALTYNFSQIFTLLPRLDFLTEVKNNEKYYFISLLFPFHLKKSNLYFSSSISKNDIISSTDSWILENPIVYTSRNIYFEQIKFTSSNISFYSDLMISENPFSKYNFGSNNLINFKLKTKKIFSISSDIYFSLFEPNFFTLENKLISKPIQISFIPILSWTFSSCILSICNQLNYSKERLSSKDNYKYQIGLKFSTLNLSINSHVSFETSYIKKQLNENNFTSSSSIWIDFLQSTQMSLPNYFVFTFNSEKYSIYDKISFIIHKQNYFYLSISEKFENEFTKKNKEVSHTKCKIAYNQIFCEAEIKKAASNTDAAYQISFGFTLRN